ncbi:hypothetical protein [Gynurincola endophyticus]|uniref:hypothetical protein n=1 Tax=Gynurincola endophyticus TaxID=2479004 RepID=UPI000F8D8446|nr:hypothetical protein [Gynurincola endophyticus]
MMKVTITILSVFFLFSCSEAEEETIAAAPVFQLNQKDSLHTNTLNAYVKKMEADLSHHLLSFEYVVKKQEGDSSRLRLSYLKQDSGLYYKIDSVRIIADQQRTVYIDDINKVVTITHTPLTKTGYLNNDLLSMLQEEYFHIDKISSEEDDFFSMKNETHIHFPFLEVVFNRTDSTLQQMSFHSRRDGLSENWQVIDTLHMRAVHYLKVEDTHHYRMENFCAIEKSAYVLKGELKKKNYQIKVLN